MNMSRIHFYHRYGKRAFDVLVAYSVLVLISPLLLLIILCSLVFLGRPVLFKQKRAGYCGKPFTLNKFRSMVDTRNECGELLPDAERTTFYGRLLRSTSMDELPSLWNVLKGEMSVVGPRPLLLEYVQLYAPEHQGRLSVKPGVTGWAAVNGRNTQSWERIFNYDVWYVDHLSFALDLEILWRTAFTILSRRGIDRGDADSGSPFAALLRAAHSERESQER
jgi:lipopolysaccharide/colanic/teichoic acid biosynthesis glycosyltransferase